MTVDEFIKKSEKIHSELYNYNNVIYKNNTTKVLIGCDKHGEFSQIPKNHTKGSGCPKCAVEYKSNKLSKTNKQIIIDFKSIHGDKYEYSLVEYKNNKTKVSIKCLTPSHGIFNVSPSHHLNGIGCPKCSGSYHRTIDELVGEMNIIHFSKYNYFINKYNNIKEKIQIKCPQHGVFTQMIGHHLNGHGCPNCYQSKGENIIEEYLLSNKIKYIKEKSFSKCLSKKGNKLRFDFYLPNYNTLIEYDGIQHFKPVEYFGGVEYLKEVNINDNIKNIFCENNNIELYRISYNQKLNQKLNKIKTEIMENT